MHEATVRTVGVKPDERTPVVLLAVGDAVVPILVTRDQAHAIRLGLDGEQFERPLTHDLFVEAVAEFGGAVDRVRIDALEDGTFYAKLDAEQYHGGERKQLVFDVRASDAVAIALRVDCPIEVSDDVVSAAGRDPDDVRVEEFDRR